MQMYISDKELPWDVSFHFSQWKETYLWKPGSSSRLHLTRKLRHTLLHSTPNHVSAHDVYFCQLSSFVFLAFFSSMGLKPHNTKDKNKKIDKSFILGWEPYQPKYNEHTSWCWEQCRTLGWGGRCVLWQILSGMELQGELDRKKREMAVGEK